MPLNIPSLQGKVLILDNRIPEDMRAVTDALELRGIQFHVESSVLKALSLIPAIQQKAPRGLVMTGDLGNNDEPFNQTSQGPLLATLEDLFPLQGKQMTHDIYKNCGQDHYSYGGVLFLRILAGYLSIHGGLQGPVSVLINSGGSPANKALQAAVPIHPQVQSFTVPDIFNDPAHAGCAKKDDPATLADFFNSLKA